MTADWSVAWGGEDASAWQVRYGFGQESSYQASSEYTVGGLLESDYLSDLTASQQTESVGASALGEFSSRGLNADSAATYFSTASASDSVSTSSPASLSVTSSGSVSSASQASQGTASEGQRTASYVPNDPLYGSQWNLTSLGMEAAWDYNAGGDSDVVVAVLDSGLSRVSDLAGSNIDWAGARNFVNGGRNVSDGFGHGTHVTGSIAQSTNNSLGVAGVAYNTTILPLKVMDNSGSAWDSDIISAIDYAIAKGAGVINLSLGGESDNPALEAAVNRAYNAGVLVVAAAGNNGSSSLDYPAAYSTVLAVGALDSGGTLAYWSSHGMDMVVAPGENIIQQLPDGSYGGWEGTSMASPQVAAVAALILAEAEDLGYTLPTGSARAEWLKSVIINNTQDLGKSGQDSTYGYGLVRADLALASLQGGFSASYSATSYAADYASDLSASYGESARSASGQDGYGLGGSQAWLSFQLQAGQTYQFSLDQAATRQVMQQEGLSIRDSAGNLLGQAQWNQDGELVLEFTAQETAQYSLVLGGVGQGDGSGLSQNMLATLQDLEINGVALGQAGDRQAGWASLLAAFQQGANGLAAVDTEQLAANLTAESQSQQQLAAA